MIAFDGAADVDLGRDCRDYGATPVLLELSARPDSDRVVGSKKRELQAWRRIWSANPIRFFVSFAPPSGG
jgi:hypothetical protein